MVPYLGDFAEDDTVYIMFNTFSSNDPSASVTITNFINTDVHIHKDDGLTQRNNAAGITVSVDFDGITGSHMIKIDTNDNTVAGFWVTGSEYFVRIEGTTVDAGTINAVVGHFSIERAGGTIALLKLIQTAVITNAQGADVATDVAAMIDGSNRVDVGSWLGQAVTLSTGNKPDVNIDEISDDTTAPGNLELMYDGTGYAGGSTKLDVNVASEDNIDFGATKKASINTEADTALSDINLDKLIPASGSVETSGANSSTQVQTDLAEATNDHYNGMMILFTSGNEAGQARLIDDYVGATGVVSWVRAVTATPADAVTFILLSITRVDVASVLGVAQTGNDNGADINSILTGTITNAQGADVATDVAAMIDGNNRVDVGSWLGQAVTLSTGNKPDVNIDEISDDATAPGNLELMYDGTGYAGGTTKFGVNVVSEDNIDFGATKKASIETEVDNAFENAIPASPVADSLNDYIQRLKWTLVNQLEVTEANGNTIVRKDDDATEAANVAAAFTSDATTTTRKRLE